MTIYLSGLGRNVHNTYAQTPFWVDHHLISLEEMHLRVVIGEIVYSSSGWRSQKETMCITMNREGTTFFLNESNPPLYNFIFLRGIGI